MVLELQLLCSYKTIAHNGCGFCLIHAARTKDSKRMAGCGAENIIMELEEVFSNIHLLLYSLE